MKFVTVGAVTELLIYCLSLLAIRSTLREGGRRVGGGGGGVGGVEATSQAFDIRSIAYDR